MVRVSSGGYRVRRDHPTVTFCNCSQVSRLCMPGLPAVRLGLEADLTSWTVVIQRVVAGSRFSPGPGMLAELRRER